MNEAIVGSRYAKSLIELAQERNAIDAVMHDMQVLGAAYDVNDVFDALMRNPVVPVDKKTGILEELARQKNMNEITVALFQVIARKRREMYLEAIAKEYIKQYRKLKSIELAEITTTFPLNDQLRNEFTNMVKQIAKVSHVELKEKVKPEIIGGYVLKVGDRQVDESIKSKLQKLKNVITK